VSFPSAGGHALAARLDVPSAVAPRAYALFAHCFTCSKESKAATFISEALTDAGIAVLRFDFTGLGGSEGDFANTTFSSNIADLIAAADWLKREHAAPSILVGHSLGGAAVLAAAANIPEAVAVAPIISWPGARTRSMSARSWRRGQAATCRPAPSTLARSTARATR